MERMNVSRVLTDEDAVSSVIGVILMIAVTVILAAAVGAFALDLASEPSTEKTPNAKFQVEWGTDGGTETVETKIFGGDTLETEYISVSLGGSVVWTYEDGAKNGMSIHDSQNWSDPEIEAQDVLGLQGSISSEGTLKVIWTRDGKSQVLKESDRS